MWIRWIRNTGLESVRVAAAVAGSTPPYSRLASRIRRSVHSASWSESSESRPRNSLAVLRRVSLKLLLTLRPVPERLRLGSVTMG